MTLSYYNETANFTTNVTTTSWNGTQGFVFDTATTFMAVATSNCTNCNPNTTAYSYYNPLDSDTYKQSDYNITSLNNTSAEPLTPWLFTGQMMQDRVCFANANATLAPDYCVDDFAFFGIDSASANFDYLDGFLGLGPTVSGNPPSFVNALSTAGVITS